MEDPHSCIICFNRLTQPVVLNCGHTFDRDCVKSCQVCPICRQTITHQVTNWQLLQILEQKGVDTRDSSVLPENYYQIKDWGLLKRGTRISYLTNRLHFGWFRRFDSARKSIDLISNDGRNLEISLGFIRKAWYYSLDEEDEEVDCMPDLFCMF